MNVFLELTPVQWMDIVLILMVHTAVNVKMDLMVMGLYATISMNAMHLKRTESNAIQMLTVPTLRLVFTVNVSRDMMAVGFKVNVETWTSVILILIVVTMKARASQTQDNSLFRMVYEALIKSNMQEYRSILYMLMRSWFQA